MNTNPANGQTPLTYIDSHSVGSLPLYPCFVKTLAISVLLSICITVKSQHAYWQQEVNFRIDVSLNDHDHSLEGFVAMRYINHSPDTLSFIWIHLWPNAYKNDRTSFSDQLLENGRTDFYFSDKDQKGYINRLDFRVDGQIPRVEDHPEFIDIIKLVLPHPLAPGDSVEITTPFHEKLPYNFSRGGHVDQSYQITQWYPKPAVYDSKGWHPMTYLDQGEFYSEFGNYIVRITIPSGYVVAATGKLQNEEEKKWMLERKGFTAPATIKTTGSKYKSIQHTQQKHQAITDSIRSSEQTKVLEYHQDKIHDFAWFADKNFLVEQDTLQLKSGKMIEIYSFYHPDVKNVWGKTISVIKSAVLFYSDLVGEYPYQTVSAVENHAEFERGMEYPTIASISPSNRPSLLSSVIFREVGHNWFYGILASNERRFPWLDEGINTYFGNRFVSWLHSSLKNPAPEKVWFKNKWPLHPDQFFIDILEKKKADQPINTTSEEFTLSNYELMPYQKTASWLKQIEDSAGTAAFDQSMRNYYGRWKFKHPTPEDFQSSLEEGTALSLNSKFSQLSKKGPLPGDMQKKKLKLAFLFSAHETDKYNYINIAPAAGYNVYDQFMAGVVVHNYNLLPEHWQFLVAPMYATGSRQLNGLGTINYSWYPDNHFSKISIGLSGERFSSLSGTDSNGLSIYGGFYKVVPSVRVIIANRFPRSHLEKWIELKTFIIAEKGFDYVKSSADSLYHPEKQSYQNRYLNQLTFNIENYRVLYPYQAALQIQQSSFFYRINLSANYFFNYAKGGGLDMRIFGAKFSYLGGVSSEKKFETTAYQPKLTASRGEDDYTYSNYFIGRNETSGFPSQQIIMKDGGLKLRTDLFQDLQGRSDNWIASMNIATTLPNHLFPIKLPLKLFFDVGTYAQAWGAAPPTSRFLYVGGLQICLLKNIVNIYIPLFYSSDFSNSLKTVPEENTFWKKISFSVDVQNVNFKRIFKNLP